ncbi:MAG: PAS domain-containing sensor histidine kinase [Methylococcales bacterium]
MPTVYQREILQSDSLFADSGANNPDLEHSQAWQALRVYFFYRFALGLFLTWAIFTGKGPSMLAEHNVTVFTYAIVAYTVLLGLSAIPLHSGKFDNRLHALFHLVLDLICIPLLIHSSGGIGSGLEALLLMSVAASGLLIGGLYSVGYAALCSLVFLGDVVYSDLYNIFENTRYTEASVLGICCFAVSLFAHSMGRRAEHSERLAQQRGQDIERLEKLNAHIIQNLQSGVMIIDPATGIKSINQSALQFFGLAQMPARISDASAELSQRYQDWLVDPHQDSFVLDGQHDHQILTRIMALQTAGKPYHMIWFEDLSVETQRIQQAKLASLGHLAASIAHEIRNPLNVISHASQLLEEAPDQNQENQQLSELIVRHSARVNKIIDNMLQLAQRKPACLETIELNSWLQDFVAQFLKDFQYNNHIIRFDNQSFPTTLNIRVDASQLKQILTNLCGNAIKHSASSADQIVELTVDVVEDSINIDVIDTGAGIPEANRAKLFEPFFTTSKTGTGLGLYISRELSELNQGSLNYFPRTQGGSIFRLNFPLQREQVISL